MSEKFELNSPKYYGTKKKKKKNTLLFEESGIFNTLWI